MERKNLKSVIDAFESAGAQVDEKIKRLAKGSGLRRDARLATLRLTRATIDEALEALRGSPPRISNKLHDDIYNVMMAAASLCDGDDFNLSLATVRLSAWRVLSRG